MCHVQHFFSQGSFECHLETENTAVKGSYLISAKQSYHSCLNLTGISLCLFITRFIHVHLAALINLFSLGAWLSLTKPHLADLDFVKDSNSRENAGQDGIIQM